MKEGDYEGLVAVMGNLFAVRERQASTDEMFEPLKQTIELLKTYDQEMPEEVHIQLQVIFFLKYFPFVVPLYKCDVIFEDLLLLLLLFCFS